MFVWTMHVELWKTQKALTFSPNNVPYTTRFDYNLKDAIFYSTSNISNEICSLSNSDRLLIPTSNLLHDVDNWMISSLVFGYEDVELSS